MTRARLHHIDTTLRDGAQLAAWEAVR